MAKAHSIEYTWTCYQDIRNYIMERYIGEDTEINLQWLKENTKLRYLTKADLTNLDDIMIIEESNIYDAFKAGMMSIEEYAYYVLAITFIWERIKECLT